MNTFALWARRVADDPGTLSAGPATGAVVALAAALIKAACDRSPRAWAQAPQASEHAQELHERALRLAEADEVAFAHYADTVRERETLAPALRDGLLQAALEHAEKTLLLMMACACDVARLADEVAEHVEIEVETEIVAAVALAEAGARVCKHVIETSFATTTSDPHVAEVKRLLSATMAARERAMTLAASSSPGERA